jgi:hypothetical protein
MMVLDGLLIEKMGSGMDYVGILLQMETDARNTCEIKAPIMERRPSHLRMEDFR